MWNAAFKFVDEFLDELERSASDSAGQRVIDAAEAGRQITLMVIASAGFGVAIDWPSRTSSAKDVTQAGLVETLKGTLELLIVKVLLPNVSQSRVCSVAGRTDTNRNHPQWIYKLPIPSIRRVDDTFNTFAAQVAAIVAQRRDEQHHGLERHDLLSRLIAASDSGSPKDKLTNQELLSNAHIFMVAGFETLAHSVAVALMFLAMYPEYQDEVAAEARSVLGADGEVAGYDKMGELVSDRVGVRVDSVARVS